MWVWYESGMESLQIIRLWAAAAWADDVLHPREESALKRLIAASDDLSEGEKEQALSFLSANPKVPVDEVRNLSQESREGVYRAALGIVMLDRELAPSEEAFLQRLRDALELEEGTIAKLDAEAR